MATKRRRRGYGQRAGQAFGNLNELQRFFLCQGDWDDPSLGFESEEQFILYVKLNRRAIEAYWANAIGPCPALRMAHGETGVSERMAEKHKRLRQIREELDV